MYEVNGKDMTREEYYKLDKMCCEILRRKYVSI